jgi:hypothetical protein
LEQFARRMGLDKVLREFPQSLSAAAARLTDYSLALPAAWTATTEPR